MSVEPEQGRQAGPDGKDGGIGPSLASESPPTMAAVTEAHCTFARGS